MTHPGRLPGPVSERWGWQLAAACRGRTRPCSSLGQRARAEPGRPRGGGEGGLPALPGPAGSARRTRWPPARPPGSGEGWPSPTGMAARLADRWVVQGEATMGGWQDPPSTPKEKVGGVTGDKHLRAEGQTDQSSATGVKLTADGRVLSSSQGTGIPQRGFPRGLVAVDDAVRYAVTPFPAGRRVVLDVLQAATHRLCVHALVEFDVTEARRRLADAPEHVSWTGFVVATVGRAVAVASGRAGSGGPHGRARRRGRVRPCRRREPRSGVRTRRRSPAVRRWWAFATSGGPGHLPAP